jgi:hypothetical protein
MKCSGIINESRIPDIYGLIYSKSFSLRRIREVMWPGKRNPPSAIVPEKLIMM